MVNRNTSVQIGKANTPVKRRRIRRASAKVHRTSKRVIKRTHHHVAKRPHNYLHQKYSWYRRWHAWRWHNFVHSVVVLSYIFAAGLIIFSITNNSGFALSSWMQTNWDSGVGTSTSNQYQSASNVDTSTTGQLSLSKSSNSFSNTGMNTDLVGWRGPNSTHNTSTKYTGTGATQITAGGVASTVFNTAATTTASAGHARVTSADLNGDGLEDVATTSITGIVVHLSNGNGALVTGTVYTNAISGFSYDIVALDYDKDGDMDLVATYVTTNLNYSVYTNNGSAVFTRNDYPLATSGSPRACAVGTADFDKNTWPDLTFSCYTQATIMVVMNNSPGSFAAATTVTLPGVMSTNASLEVGDINNDTNPDVVVTSGNYGCTIWYSLGTGGGLSTGQSTSAITNCGTSNNAYINGLGGGDFNKDGYFDIVFTRRSGTGTGATSDSRYVTVMFGDSLGALTGQLDLAADTGAGVSNNYPDFTVQDFDGDNDLDIFMVNGINTTGGYYAGDGAGGFTARVNYGIGGTLAYGVTALSLYGDGKKDIVVARYNNPSLGTLGVLTNRTRGDTFTQQVDLGSTDTYQIEAYVRNVSGTVFTTADGELFVNGNTVTTTVSPTSTSGWYKLTGTVTGSNNSAGYGVIAKQGKTIFVDDLSLYKYATFGSLQSAIFDLSFGGDWDTLVFNKTGNATVKVRTGNAANMSDATAFSSCTAITSGTDLTGQSCVDDNDRYVQYQVALTAISGNTPVFDDLTIQYDPYDNVAPDTNASAISMSKVNGGISVASNGWTNGASPYFAWTAGTDNGGGSGLLGYCMYLGTDNSADPTTTKGMLGTSPVNDSTCPFIVPSNNLDLATAGLIQTALTTSNAPYYLSIKALDIAGNVYNGSSEQFHFRFDNTPPTNPGFLTTPSQYISNKSTIMTWPTSGGGAATDANSGVAGLQYQIGSSGWYGDDHTGSGGIDDLLDNDGSYTTTAPDPPDEDNLDEGVNTVYLRTWDAAGNTSSSNISAAIKINTSSAPSAPQGVGATPTTNTINAFAFNWSEPSSYLGSADNLSYCYTVNTLPNANNCTYTASGATELESGAYANQPGENTLYVVAKDESGNINYSNHASVSFFANTSAPGIPLNADVADVSVKATSNWRLAITWDAPTSVGAGVQTYKIYRSTDNTNFSFAGSSTSTSYVDTNLSQVRYYYKVRACDSANNCGADSSVVNKIPTGKFTTAAGITSTPKVSAVTTKRASISWSTDRASDSKVAIGTSSGKYSASEIGNSDQVTAHSLDLDNLAAGTTYYFKARWTDEDGNTGSSQEYSFKTAPAPVLKEVDTTSIGLSNATIEFTTIDAVKVDLNFGQNDAFGGVKSINTSSDESTYQISLTGLNDGTKYLYKISMYDSENGVYQSSIFSFTTPPRPSISNLRFQPVDGEPTSTQKVTWNTNVPTTSLIEYTKVGGKSLTIQNNEMKTSHSITIRGLEDSSKYSLVAQGRDSAGNLAESDRQVFETALDTRPPAIDNVVIEPSVRGTGAESRGQIVVSWTTDEPSTSQVAFGEGSNVTVFNNRTAEDGQLTTEHLVIVSDLPPSKVYSIAPESRDKAGNKTTAKPQAAIIGRATDSVLSIVLNTLKNVFGL
jgi:hypothetical protein